MTEATRERVLGDVKRALKAGERDRVATLRLIAAEIKQREVDERRTLVESDMLALLDRMAKQRRESIAQFEAAGREDLVERERAELAYIQEYLPSQLSESELERLIDQAVARTGADSPRAMGDVMSVLRPQVQGRADMSAVSRRVRERLAEG